MTDRRKPIPPYDKPTRARAVDGEVTLTGPGNIGLSLTPEAAHASAKDIVKATEKAHRQRAEQQARSGTLKNDPTVAPLTPRPSTRH